VTAWDFFFPEDQARIRDDLFPRAFREGHAEREVRFRHFKTGESRWMAYKLLALTDAAGKPHAIGTVSQDITLRKKLEDNLRSLAAELAATDRRKDEFLATLAHELRGPLAPLANVLELWKRSSSREQLQRARETMERQLGQLIRLVDDLLDLNRVTHDRLELRKARVDLADVIEHAIEACRPSFDQREQRLSVALPKEPCPLYADPARLMQVFANLLSNSSKYTDPGGEISVSAQREGNSVVVSVRDNGIGIPADKLDRVFDMFEQVGSALERSQGGLGIGLTLVKRLVGLHDGRVEARSAGLGRGSEFVVRLPVDESQEEPAAVTASQVTSRRRKILVVDDNADTVNSMCTLLELAGHDAIAVNDGVNAVEAAKKHQPEAVLLDIGMPQMDGHEVCRRLRELPNGDNLVIIAVTGWGQGDDPQKWQAASFDGHLVKPARLDALMALLSELDEPRSAGIAS
jgi:signal transduction histidine kinase/ActR/RegA family two-component response regulator